MATSSDRLLVSLGCSEVRTAKVARPRANRDKVEAYSRVQIAVIACGVADACGWIEPRRGQAYQEFQGMARVVIDACGIFRATHTTSAQHCNKHCLWRRQLSFISRLSWNDSERSMIFNRLRRSSHARCEGVHDFLHRRDDAFLSTQRIGDAIWYILHRCVGSCQYLFSYFPRLCITSLHDEGAFLSALNSRPPCRTEICWQ